MALIVEDGTGRTDAETYISVNVFKTFCLKRGYDVDAYDLDVMEIALRKAADYINTQFRYKGFRLTGDQAMEFPRNSLYDWSGLLVTGVPMRVKNACCELAFKALTQPLYQDQNRGGKVVSESVGPISTTYAEDAPTGIVWQQAWNFLQPFVRDPKHIYGPFFGNTGTAAVSIGMMDNPGSGLTSTSDPLRE